MRTNTRKENVSADHGGNECEGPTSIEESCNVQECPGKIFICGNYCSIIGLMLLN